MFELQLVLGNQYYIKYTPSKENKSKYLLIVSNNLGTLKYMCNHAPR